VNRFADGGEIRQRWRMAIVPTGSVMLGSAITALPIVVSSPVLPPFGLMLLLSWRLLRSDIWPIWIGIPLGMWDDLLSGQPLGSAIALWCAIMLAIDAFDRRIVWRDFRIDWAVSCIALAAAILGAAILARAGGPEAILRLVGPQILFACCLMPAIFALTGRLDAWRRKR